jgi:hypothetical protein
MTDIEDMENETMDILEEEPEEEFPEEDYPEEELIEEEALEGVMAEK